MANFSFYDFQYFPIDPISQLAGLNTAIYQTFESISSSHEPFFVNHQSPDFPGKSAAEAEIFPPSNQNHPCQVSVPCAANKDEAFPNVETKKRKAIATVVASENSCSGISWISGQVSHNENISTTKRSRKGKRLKNADEEETLTEVVHVRARRGQATDSHSLAERVRREKINERLRCLQDIVPGCYKTMGMATMLDEIINYVQSLQNQVEFLSMKLTAASTFYDFNSETDVIDSVQRAKAREATETGRQGKDGKDGNAVFSSSWTL